MANKITKAAAVIASPGIPSASADLIRAGSPIDSVVVGNRTISLKRPGVLAQYRMVDIVGANTAKNSVYMEMILPIMWVTHIDSVEIPQPQNKMELEAIIQRLGEDAIVAVGETIVQMVSAQESVATVKK